MPHEEMAAPTERDQVVWIELEIRRDVKRYDVMRLERPFPAANLAGPDRPHEPLTDG
jgi:hypothetical protein